MITPSPEQWSAVARTIFAQFGFDQVGAECRVLPMFGGPDHQITITFPVRLPSNDPIEGFRPLIEAVRNSAIVQHEKVVAAKLIGEQLNRMEEHLKKLVTPPAAEAQA